eukprot:Gregarina_sp_Poly_1__9278@NODE_574_length_7474_cov_93_385311_g158_i1_p6_GENE_NODE_574_length_7474_cov_93_385311_g158_i1NODE_574_length_7474_cov_93_385311_g158_i1_p6_ORF_typecomplete_len175_score21_23_NODE_574_length_7474_cov_93_385311_g158_i127693293
MWDDPIYERCDSKARFSIPLPLVGGSIATERDGAGSGAKIEVGRDDGGRDDGDRDDVGREDVGRDNGTDVGGVMTDEECRTCRGLIACENHNGGSLPTSRFIGRSVGRKASVCCRLYLETPSTNRGKSFPILETVSPIRETPSPGLVMLPPGMLRRDTLSGGDMWVEIASRVSE